MPDEEAADNPKSKIANLKSAWRWWRGLRQNPIYRRERGEWGRPNPFYDSVNRFSPLFVLAALVIGGCTLYTNPALLAGGAFGPLFCLYCLPGIAVSALTLFGSFMAPAATAPTLSLEMSQGTWDILRLTPQSTLSILLAKLFGGLSRLPIWTLLGVLTLIQSCFLTLGLALTSDGEGDALEFFMIILTGLFLVSRPWLEILFAAFLGMYSSTWIPTPALALATSYGALLLMKVIVWLSAGVLPLIWMDYYSFGEGTLVILMSAGGPVLLYGVVTAALLYGLFHRAQKLS
jgi:hypothetical protein